MKLGGGVTFQDDVCYEENDFDGSKQMAAMSKVATLSDATPSDATPSDATPMDAILKDEDGYITSGKWECENGIIVELADNVLIIDGKGKIESDVKNIIKETICRSNKYKVKCIISDGITELCDNLFEYCDGLDSIKISNIMTSIGNYTFYYCRSLSSIEIPNNVMSIGNRAFTGCSSLSSIEIPNSVTDIGELAFAGCGLTSIEIPSSVTSIGQGIFNKCNSLNSVKIPNSVTSIGNHAFSECISLSSIEIPNSVTNIENYAFGFCSSLSSIEISSSVTSIGDCAFIGCSSLTKIINHSSASLALDSSIHSDENGQWYLENTDTVVTSISNGQTAIYKKAGEEDKPSDATPIDAILKDEEGYITSGKWECANGIIVELANNVLTIDGKGKIESDVKNIIGKTICKSYKYKVKCIIRDGITELRDGLFSDCVGLDSIEIPNSVESIGDSAFFGCSSLSSIEIPNGVMSIGLSAFNGCSSLSSIKIPNSVTSIEEFAFSECSSLSSIEIPNSVTSIGSHAFNFCMSLSSIEIPNSVTSIEDYAFYYCSSLSSIEIPSSVTSIEDYAFYYCSSLSSIEIPSSVTSIGNSAFKYCNNLTKIINHSSAVLALDSSIHAGENGEWYLENTDTVVTSISNGQTAIYEKADEEKDEDGYIVSGKWECENGIIVELADNVLTIDGKGKIESDVMDIIGETICKSGKYKVKCIIHDGITQICGNLFLNCDALDSIEIPNSVTSIGVNAFNGCSSLSSIELSNGVTSIEGSAFSGCSSLSSIKIPNSVVRIEVGAFVGCDSLSSIEIPSSVTSIGMDLFLGCNSLTKITNHSLASLLLDSIHSDENSQWYLENTDTVVTSVSNGQTAIYKKADEDDKPSDVTPKDEDGYIISGKWECANGIIVELADNVLTIDGKGKIESDVMDIIGETICKSGKYKVKCIIRDGITELCEQLFFHCDGLNSIEIPNSITSIGIRVFAGCSNLSNIEIPNSVTSIGRSAFNKCSSLNSIKIPNSVTNIESMAFSLCGSLSSIEIPSSVTSIGDRAFAGCSSLTTITNHSSASLTLDSSIHSDENGQWYIENIDTIVTSISDGQTAIYKKADEDDKPIEDVKYGDISGDGEINVQDAVLLKKHLASIKGMNINEQACDVNADGTVNIQDAVILLKHLAGMDVTLGKQKVLE